MKKSMFNKRNLISIGLSDNCLVLILITLSFLMCGSCNNSKKGNDKVSNGTYFDTHGFSFKIPKDCENITNDELGKLLKQGNPSIDYLAKVAFPFGNSLFSVSTFVNEEKIYMDSAFIKTVNYVATLRGDTVKNYRLVDYGIKKLNNKILRYKISCAYDSVYSVMYYFMKDDYSRFMNEMKITCRGQNNLKTVQNYLEKIALTVNFKEP